jgi:hypothetical protein
MRETGKRIRKNRTDNKIFWVTNPRRWASFIQSQSILTVSLEDKMPITPIETAQYKVHLRLKIKNRMRNPVEITSTDIIGDDLFMSIKKECK